jgi:hypothetical protein
VSTAAMLRVLLRVLLLVLQIWVMLVLELA